MRSLFLLVLSILVTIYLAHDFPHAAWVPVIAGMFGGCWYYESVGRNRFEPFAVSFRIEFFYVLTGIGIITEDEFRAYNGQAIGINRLEPLQQMVEKGVKAIVVGLCDRNRRTLVHWTQEGIYSSGFSFRKRLDMIPSRKEFGAWHPGFFIRSASTRYVVGISVPTPWWQANKDGEGIKKFVIAVEDGDWETNLILATIPDAVFAPYYGDRGSFFWEKRVERADRVAEASGLRKSAHWYSTYSNECFTVAIQFVST
ncbi:hypothetical protein AB4Y89_21645 [Terriglobus sp. 2YAB30_2]|uniref:hypothetical protein n=1 Tax=unclassified Terriglobus TaxID=2628988 RepID=UPI003F950AAD